MRYIHRTIAKQLTDELSLGGSGQEQDWEVELSDGDRVEEFIAKYHSGQRADDRDFALVSLIVASFDNRLADRLYESEGEYREVFDRCGSKTDLVYTQDEIAIWKKIRAILNSNLSLYNQIIQYWSGENQDGVAFASTLFFMEL